MRRCRHLSLVLLLLTAGCIDLVDPAVLGLSEPVRIEMFVEVSSSAEPLGCSTLDGFDPPAVPGDVGDQVFTTLCMQASVDPGRDKFAVARTLSDPAILLMHDVVSPEQAGDSLLSYRRQQSLTGASLADTSVTVVLPSVDGVDLPARASSWPLIGPPSELTAFPDSSGLVLTLEAPTAEAVPAPFSSTWSLTVYGDSGTVALHGDGQPRTSFSFPAEVLADLGPIQTATLRWTRRLLARSTDEYHIDVFVVQLVRWRIEIDEANAR